MGKNMMKMKLNVQRHKSTKMGREIKKEIIGSKL